MVTPDWIASTLDEFGRGLGLKALALNDVDAVSLRFENGWRLRFEYAEETLNVMITMEVEQDEEMMRRILMAASPEVERPYPLRAAYLADSREALFAIRLPEREVTLVALDTAFQELWETVEGLRG